MWSQHETILTLKGFLTSSINQEVYNQKSVMWIRLMGDLLDSNHMENADPGGKNHQIFAKKCKKLNKKSVNLFIKEIFRKF